MESMNDIIAEIRAYGAQPPPRLMWLEIADRLESAWKREREKIAAETRQRSAADSGCPNVLRDTDIIAQSASIGNAAVLREALESADSLIAEGIETEVDKELEHPFHLEFAREQIAAALAAPARNCDMQYKDRVEMYGAFKDWCKAKGHTMEPMLAYDAFDWLLALAAERKGDGDGSK